MKTKKIFLCLMILLVTQILAFGQKTEVHVKKGKVIARTTGGSATVDAGQKAVLTDDNLTITVDDPMVDDIMKVYKWIETEKEVNEITIDSVGIMVVSMDSEHLVRSAFLMEIPNTGTQLSDTCRIGPTAILDKPKYYDLEGNLLSVKLEKVKESQGYYHLYFPKPVEPGDKFKFVCVTELTSLRDGIWKEGSLWYIKLDNHATNCLSYYKLILPKSAIYVDSNPPIITTSSVNGRTAVVIGSYTGKEAYEQLRVTFLWPDKDGTTLANIPAEYYALPVRLRGGQAEEPTQSKKLPSLEALPWNNAGPEAIKVYQKFIGEIGKSPKEWFTLGVKLVGGSYWDEAFNAFQRCENLTKYQKGFYHSVALVWQGHIYDLKGQRNNALSKYKAALKTRSFQIQHDQWNIALNSKWIKDRLEKPFTKEMMGK